MLPPEVAATAEALGLLNDMFDVLNSSSQYNKCKWKRSFTSTTAPGHIELLQNTANWIQRWKIGNNARVESLKGLGITVAGVIGMWERLGGELGILSTRRLQQDALENFFGVVRQRGGQNDAPNPTQFRNAYRQASVNSLLQAPASANCEPDTDSLVNILTSETARVNRPHPAVTVTTNFAPGCVFDVPIDVATSNVLAYIAGYLVRKGCEGHTCSVCTSVLVTGDKTATCDRDTFTELKSFTGEVDGDVGSLHVVSDMFYDFVCRAYTIGQSLAPSMLTGTGIVRRLSTCLESSDEHNALLRVLCPGNVLGKMGEIFMRMQVHKLCIETCCSGQRTNKVNRKLLKLSTR